MVGFPFSEHLSPSRKPCRSGTTPKTASLRARTYTQVGGCTRTMAKKGDHLAGPQEAPAHSVRVTTSRLHGLLVDRHVVDVQQFLFVKDHLLPAEPDNVVL